MTLLVTTGCQRGDQPRLGTVSGVITFEGKPLPYALVAFHPEQGRVSLSGTDANGRYNLVYVRDIQGAKVGKHSVRITMISREERDDDPHTRSEPDPTWLPRFLPKKYNTETTLHVEVKPGTNTFDFDLRAND